VLRALRSTLREGDLVAVHLPPGPRWVGLLAAAREAGAAVLPVDSRLAAREASRLVSRARPTVVVDAAGPRRRRGGVPVFPGTALVVATSGTSGPPRLAELNRTAVEAAVKASAEALAAGPDDRWFCCIPVAHIGGALVLQRVLMLGAPLTISRSFSIPAFCRAAGSCRFSSIVPTQLLRLLDAGCDLRGLTALLVGGAALSAELAARAHAAGIPAVPTYGLTESCGGVVYAGRPLSGVAVRVLRDGAPAARGEGELLLRGPTLMRGYRFDAAATAAAFTAEGWLRTGDAGAIGRDGAIRVDGRQADVINTGGEKVWPGEVEAALASHPGVAEVAVSGAPDPEWGQQVIAHVVPRRRGAPPTLEALRAYLAGRIAAYKAPRRLVLVASLPRTSLGKVSRAAQAGAQRKA
jgi:O-succinylbenzoic acid--CoA ligase